VVRCGDIYYFKFGIKEDEVLLEHIFYSPPHSIISGPIISRDDHIRSLIILQIGSVDDVNGNFLYQPRIHRYDFFNFHPQSLWNNDNFISSMHDSCLRKPVKQSVITKPVWLRVTQKPLQKMLTVNHNKLNGIWGFWKWLLQDS